MLGASEASVFNWTVDPAKIDPETYDLSVVNPNIEEEKLPSAAKCKAILKEAFE